MYVLRGNLCHFNNHAVEERIVIMGLHRQNLVDRFFLYFHLFIEQNPLHFHICFWRKTDVSSNLQTDMF